MNFSPKRSLSQTEIDNIVSTYKEKYGANKIIPSDFEAGFYIALSGYPELFDKEIEIIEKHFDLTLQAQPEPQFLFKKPQGRGYRINVNVDPSRANGVMFTQLPFNAQVGIMAHEMAHLAGYTTMTVRDIIILGLRFLGIKFRKEYERETDLEVIRRGFGWQLYDWADFAMYTSSSPSRHKYYKYGYYLSPEEVLEYIQSFTDLYPKEH